MVEAVLRTEGGLEQRSAVAARAVIEGEKLFDLLAAELRLARVFLAVDRHLR